jgi:DNA mismatch endonuclease, patch repair protein
MKAPHSSSEAATRRMQATARRDTSAELRIRRELHRRGLRYRVDYSVVGRRRRVDIVFTRARLAVFVDGCFWHACPLHGTSPKANAQWWTTKLAANVRRDRLADEELAAQGFTVMRVWEHEDPIAVAESIEKAVRSRLTSNRRISSN